MRILFIGDIVGKPGRRAVHELLPGLIAAHGIDFVVANGENAAAGFGMTREIVEDLFGSRIDVLTTGNHVWDKKEIVECIDDYESLLRPANYPARVPGHGSVVMPVREGLQVGEGGGVLPGNPQGEPLEEIQVHEVVLVPVGKPNFADVTR
ncbi:MAG: hypothetical protein A4E73_03471 [Syntrophaceae bacterium PtaU1.Bin231]|nr:MAG: hypothetical protein A4E73_03471 [Syntrophaceae bacterium PtaU1.Bin231]